MAIPLDIKTRDPYTEVVTDFSMASKGGVSNTMKPELVQTTIFKCRFCGNPKPSGRTDREYCNDACKLKAYRWRKRMTRYEYMANVNIINVAGYLDYPETFNQALEKLKSLKADIDVQLKLHNVVKVK